MHLASAIRYQPTHKSMSLDSIPTPSVLIEVSRLQKNLQRMQERANAQGVRLRPHTKTHKSAKLARMQQELGAHGLTVAKTGEAEVFVSQGFEDICIAYPVVGDDKFQRILRLMDKASISFCVDTLEGARMASAFFSQQGKEANVLIEVDTGYGRCGVSWDDPDSITFAAEVAGMSGLRLTGILTHAGQAYKPAEDGNSKKETLVKASANERDTMLTFANRLAEAGIEGVRPGNFTISVGSTPTMRYFENKEQVGFKVTEIRPGNYLFNDAMQVSVGSATLKECALTVRTMVASKHRNRSGSERLFLDAGRKVFTGDTGPGTDGFGVLLYNPKTMLPLPHARITGLSEEHGWVQVPGGSTLDVGNTVRVVPNHACVVVNGQDKLYLVDGNQVIEEITVDARGRSW